MLPVRDQLCACTLRLALRNSITKPRTRLTFVLFMAFPFRVQLDSARRQTIMKTVCPLDRVERCKCQSVDKKVVRLVRAMSNNCKEGSRLVHTDSVCNALIAATPGRAPSGTNGYIAIGVCPIASRSSANRKRSRNGVVVIDHPDPELSAMT